MPIDEDIILARENTNQTEIRAWLQNPVSKIFKIKSASKIESLLFLLSSISKSNFNKETIDSLLSQIVIIQDAKQWHPLTEHAESKKLILIPFFGTPDNLGYLKDNGYKIFIPMGNDDSRNNESDIVIIEPFNTNILYPILETKVKSYEKANYLINRLGKQAAVLHLQRLMERDDAVLPVPTWAKKENWNILVLAALVGSWNDNNDKDKEFVAKLFNLDYDEVTRQLSLHTKIEEAPIKKMVQLGKLRPQKL